MIHLVYAHLNGAFNLHFKPIWIPNLSSVKYEKGPHQASIQIQQSQCLVTTLKCYLWISLTVKRQHLHSHKNKIPEYKQN